MSEEILVNVSPIECRVAVLDNGLVQEVYYERARRNSCVGNLYKGRVVRVMPGMQAAFVDIGLERTAFLHAADLRPPPAAAAAGDERPPCISRRLAAGDEVIVQVVKDPLGQKGARLTAQISLPSRYLVMLPGVANIGVSVRIEDEAERERLRQLLIALLDERRMAELNAGWILRTNADGCAAEALARDIDYLSRLWSVVEQRAAAAACGDCIFEELSLPLRLMRDLWHADTARVRVDEPRTLDKIATFAAAYISGGTVDLELHTGSRPLFDHYGVEDEIQRALQRTVSLKSGGYIVIDRTEALIAIDVNTGGYLGQRNMEETLFRTNLEAAQAIARQLRLRNLGGIIIIDFIDMQDERHREQVLRTLEQALARDHARTRLYAFSELGLVQLTRKRTTESLEQLLTEPCERCAGSGRVKTVMSVCGEIFREIQRAARQFESGRLMVIAAPAVIETIGDEFTATIAELEERGAPPIALKAEEGYGQEQFDVVLL